MTPSLSIASKLLHCTEKGDSAAIARLLKLKNCSQIDGTAALHRGAVEHGHAECVKLLISISHIQADDSFALRLAASKGHAECLRLLIPGSDPHARESQALRSAAFHGHADCVALLFPVSDPKARSFEALCSAAVNGHAECVKLLIPASPPLLFDPYPFHQAIEAGQAGIVALMLSHEPALVGLIDVAGSRRNALQANHRELAELLLSIHESLEIGDSLLDGQSSPQLRAPRL